MQFRYPEVELFKFVIFIINNMQFNQAIIMLNKDPQFKTDWKFDHVWNMIKTLKTFIDDATSPNDHVINSLTQVFPGLFSFSPNFKRWRRNYQWIFLSTSKWGEKVKNEKKTWWSSINGYKNFRRRK